MFATAWDLVRGLGSCQLPMVLGGGLWQEKKGIGHFGNHSDKNLLYSRVVE